jgi:hypothetical protein
MNYIKAKWQQFTEWAAWRAWNYARKREMKRRLSLGLEPAETANDATPEQRRIISNEARQLLENKHFREAFGAVDAAIEMQASSCDPDNKDKAQRIIIAKQMLLAVRREILRKLDDGWMAEAQIVEIENARKRARFVR